MCGIVGLLVKKPALREQLGSEFVAEFVRLKRMEWVDYHRHVSDWEIKRYLEFH
jgi:glutamine synthetase